MTNQDHIAKAQELGREAGLAAASWVFDGNSSEKDYVRVYQGLEDGDPEVLDALPSPNLSGEWADDPTPKSLFEEITGADAHAESSWNYDAYQATLEEICAAWEQAAADAVQEEVGRLAREHLEAQAPAAMLGVSAYVQIGETSSPNLEWSPETDDPDEYSDDILKELHLPEGLEWRLTGGDDHGDGLTSFDYIAEADFSQVKTFLEWIGQDVDHATQNMGLLTGPEEYGLIPGGITFNADGMDWNIGGVTRIAGADFSIWPISIPAAEIVFGDLR